MTDDQGYGVPGTFGGVIPTPALDRVAKAGLRYTQFNSTALCSPTRAALITGRNHHAVGFGVISELSTGFPGYDSIIGPENATVGRILADNGYATSWFGKNHNTPGFQYSVSGPFDQWPSGMGFQYFYGFMGGETDQWQPYLFRDHSQVFPWIGRKDYNLTTDMADEAIRHMRGLNAAAPDQPFFVYYVPGGSHSPHQPKKEWIDKFKGKFDMGWEKLRDQIFANQKRLGVIPANAKLTPWPDELPKWDSLSMLQKKLYARQAEVYAAYTAYTDYEIGRVIQAVQDMGKLDNTLIIYIDGDNGTSPEGTLSGTYNQMTAYNGILDVPEPLQLLHYEDWGSAATYPHMAVAWSWAFDTPFKWTKQVASHFGGTRQGMAISWPGPHQGCRRHSPPVPPHDRHRADDPRSHRGQGAATGGRHRPEADRRREHDVHVRCRERQRAVDAQDAVLRDGRQSRHLQRRLVRQHAPAGAPVAVEREVSGRRRLQVGAVQPCRGLLAERRPRREDAGQVEGDAGAVPAGGEKYDVLPLDNSQFQRAIAPRPSAVAGQDVFTYVGENAGIPTGNAPNILNKSFTITAEIEVPAGGGNGMIVTEGGKFGGYALYLLKGKPVFVYNLLDLKRSRWEGGVGGADWLGKSLSPGKHTIVFDFKYDGPGIAKGGSGVLKVDGRDFATLKVEHTIPFLLPPDETFDVGVDTRTPVDSSYQIPFPVRRQDQQADVQARSLTTDRVRRAGECRKRSRERAIRNRVSNSRGRHR